MRVFTLIEFPTRLMMICRNLPGSPIRIFGTFSDTYTASCSKYGARENYSHMQKKS
jgi:hypothetical protein